MDQKLEQHIEQHIEETLNRIRSFYIEAATRIEALQGDGKIPATKLAEDIAKQHGMTGPQLYPTLKFLFDKYPEVEVLRGAHGGIRKVRVPKVSP